MFLSGGRRERGFAVPADKLNLTASEGNNKLFVTSLAFCNTPIFYLVYF